MSFFDNYVAPVAGFVNRHPVSTAALIFVAMQPMVAANLIQDAIKSAMASHTFEEVCAEWFSYQKMCDLVNSGMVQFPESVSVVTAEGDDWGQASVGAVCSLAELMKKAILEGYGQSTGDCSVPAAAP